MCSGFTLAGDQPTDSEVPMHRVGEPTDAEASHSVKRLSESKHREAEQSKADHGQCQHLRPQDIESDAFEGQQGTSPFVWARIISASGAT